MLREQGFQATRLQNGVSEWRAQGQKIETLNQGDKHVF